MREIFAKSVVDPRVSVKEGSFDHTGVESGAADLVVVAQARIYHLHPLSHTQRACNWSRLSIGVLTMPLRQKNSPAFSNQMVPLH